MVHPLKQKYPYYNPLIQLLTFINLVATCINDQGALRHLLLVKLFNMKRITFLALLFVSLGADAQIKEGKVVYERTTQMQRPRGIPDDVVFPTTRKNNFELQFGNNQSVWQSIPNPEGDNNTFTAPGIVMRMAGNEDLTYYNFTTGRRSDLREMLEREFLVEDSITKLSWKLTDESKDILGHPARKATAVRIAPRMQTTMENGQMKREQVSDTSQIVAWFTTDVTVPAGPQDFGGQLPGLILELSINNDRSVFRAVEFSTKVNASKIKEPKGGKKLTSAEFAIERDKLMEEMRRNNPGGNHTIRMNN
jgi:GLPGLI family protein